MLKLHFSPVRCCDISTDERLLLTASDDKSVKLTWLAERRFAATFAGHSNWVRSASLSSSSTHMVSGGDDKTVKLWDVEQKSCLQTFSDSASSITCTRFGLGDHVIIASSWDSCINLWDVRSYGIRQHYGRAHGGSPITQVAVHPRSDLILSSSSDRQLRVWDLRAGKLCCTVLGHERPVHSCGFDEAGDHFLSCDSEMVLYWSCPPLAAPCPPAQPEPTPISLEAEDALNLPSSAPRIDGPASEAGRSAEASDPLLAGEAAPWKQAEVPRSRKAPKEERLREALPEVVARMVEKMVTDMASLHQNRIFERESLGPKRCERGRLTRKLQVQTSIDFQRLRNDVEDRWASQVNPSQFMSLAWPIGLGDFECEWLLANYCFRK
ncbi:poc1b [Symbiodinium sp. CCMP2592]|nr:poc1b [Symbiodinium sp. CCMP2592]